MMKTKNLVKNSQGFIETKIDGNLVKNTEEDDANRNDFEVFRMKLGANNESSKMQKKYVKPQPETENPQNNDEISKETIFDINTRISLDVKDPAVRFKNDLTVKNQLESERISRFDDVNFERQRESLSNLKSDRNRSKSRHKMLKIGVDESTEIFHRDNVNV